MHRLDFGFQQPSQPCCMSVKSIWSGRCKLSHSESGLLHIGITENDQTRCHRADREHKCRNDPFFGLKKQMFGGSFPPFPCPSPTSPPPPPLCLFALMWQMASWLILPGPQRCDIYVVINTIRLLLRWKTVVKLQECVPTALLKTLKTYLKGLCWHTGR